MLHKKMWGFRACLSALAVVPLAATIGLLGAAKSEAADMACDATSPNVLCGYVSAEDLVSVPGTKWVLVSSYTTVGLPGNGLVLVDSVTRERQPVIWASGEGRGAPDCPGPLDQADMSPHGLNIVAGETSLTAYVVNHGRRAIEIFDVTAGDAPPKFTWRGCVVLPESVNPNGVAALPDGRIAVTAFLVNGDPDAVKKFFARENTGFVALWHPTSGWSELAGSEASGNNGIAVSKDGKHLYMGAWSGTEVVRLTIDAIPHERVSIPLDFLVDNLHFGRDGRLLVAGQHSNLEGGFSCVAGPDSPVVCPLDTKAVAIDPATLAVTELFTLPGSPQFGAGTAVLELDQEYWVGTFRGNAIARVPR